MRIIPGSGADYLEIVEVWEESVRASHHFLSEEDIQYYKPLILSAYLDAVDLYCLKDEAETIHGFLGVVGQSIEMLFLAAGSRSQGLCRRLVDYARQELGARRVSVNEQNPAAVGFYEHLGFRVVDRSPVDGQGKPYPILHMALPPEQDGAA